MGLIFLSFEWAIFILAGSVVAPIAVGAAFGLPINEIGTMLQRSLFVIGIGSLIQCYFGHRLPIAEGPAGLWWGVFLIYGGIGSSLGMDSYEILQNMEMGLIISGLVFVGMGLFKVIHRIKYIFTPLVTGTYLILLIAQLSGSFIKGILGIGYLTPYVDMKVSLAAIVTLIFTVTLAKSPYPKLRNFYILYGIFFGWMVFKFLGITRTMAMDMVPWFSLPQLLPWGPPRLSANMVLTSIMTAMLLLSNLIASIEVVGKAVDAHGEKHFNGAGLVMGINQIMAGLFSTIGFVPVSISAGFIITTRIKEKKPFIIGSILVLLISFFPKITLFFASLPTPVGYGAIFLVFSNMITVALKEYKTLGPDDDKLLVIGTSLMIGMGSMFIPVETLKYVPSVFVPILNNGLILGVILAVILEQGIDWKRRSGVRIDK